MTSTRIRVCAKQRSSRSSRCIGLCALLVAVLLAAPVQAQPDLETDDEKVIYFIGILTARQLSMLNLSDEEVDIVVRGIRDAAGGTAMQINPEEFGPKLRMFQQERAKLTFGVEQKKSAAYLSEQKSESGATVTESGLIYTETEAGSGAQPELSSTVSVTYEGRLRDGTIFDGGTSEFPLDGVIKCWGEGVARMKVGGKAKLVCPSEIAYGERGAPPVIPPGAALTFDVELLEIVAAKE